MKGLIGKKLGMTSVFTEAGNSVACTLIEVGPCYVSAIKTKENVSSMQKFGCKFMNY